MNANWLKFQSFLEQFVFLNNSMIHVSCYETRIASRRLVDYHLSSNYTR